MSGGSAIIPPPPAAWLGFASGTEALAASIAFAADQIGGAPTVWLPAYSCPSLVAATRYAGLPVGFLDLAPGALAPAARQYAEALSRQPAIAVVVDLFGVPGPTEELAARRPAGGLIHDRAQALAAPGLPVEWAADAVITSHGRGKPITLLGGGAAWHRQAAAFYAFAARRYPEKPWSPRLLRLKASVYNAALQPRAYGLIARLPFLRLGETRLQSLPAVHRLPASFLDAATMQGQRLAAQQAGRRQRSAAALEIALAAGLEVPAEAQAAAASLGLNRLPALCASPEQASRLRQAGRTLGLSSMYGRTLPEFSGCTEARAAREYPHAFSLSRRLVTLPTHSRIDDRERLRLEWVFRYGH